jgi:16S rRNA (cytosine967-C5)-methyltransferase
VTVIKRRGRPEGGRPSSPGRPRRGKGARDVALEVLLRVQRDGAFAAAALDSEIRKGAIEGREAALATELVMGVLRWQGELDRILEGHVNRGLSSLDDVVHAALRLGAYQLSEECRVPQHAAVSETVKLIRALRSKGSAGFGNAILRSIGRSGGVLLDASRTLPEWLFERFAESYGRDVAVELARGSVEQPWLGLRLTGAARKTLSVEEVIRSVLTDAPKAQIEGSELAPQALRARSLGPLRGLTVFRDGAVVVQDVGAQACAHLLDAQPGHRLLDACAGRGGKTLFFADMTDGEAHIDAADRHPRKLEILESEVARLGLEGVRTVCVDLERGAAGLEPGYDRIFLDVPCSGTGTLARRPEIRWRLNPDKITGLVRTQAKLLDRCLELLAPSGVLVYCACSLL